MANVLIQTQLTTEQIIDVIGQLDASDLESVLRKAMQFQAKQKGQSQFQRESELLNRIFQKKSATFRRRFDRLKTKCKAFKLTTQEHEEFLRLLEEVQKEDVEYVEALTELAQLHNVTLPVLMEQLGIKAR